MTGAVVAAGSSPASPVKATCSRAVAIFERVRSAFAEQDNAYDSALVTLELAEVYASLGRIAEVKTMAHKLAPIFDTQGVHRAQLDELVQVVADPVDGDDRRSRVRHPSTGLTSSTTSEGRRGAH